LLGRRERNNGINTLRGWERNMRERREGGKGKEERKNIGEGMFDVKERMNGIEE
jgi:hypothetical protein